MNAQTHPSARRAARRAVLLAALAVPLLAACGPVAGRPATVGAAPSAPAVAPTDHATAPTARATTPAGTATRPAVTGSIPGLPGWLYYVDRRPSGKQRVVRLTRGGPVQVLADHGHSSNVSPDGRHIAYVDGHGTVHVARADGSGDRALLTGSVESGYEPAWAPDSMRILVATWKPNRATPGVLDIRTGRFTPLAHDPHGLHYLWSADGRHLGFVTGTCQVGTSDADGGHARLVPQLGDPDRNTNPQRRRSCDPFSLSPHATQMAVLLNTGDMPDGDIFRELFANAVIGTRTGATVHLPVTGQITAVYFQPDGTVLVRTRGTGHNTLTLLSPGGSVVARVAEPASMARMLLLADVPR